MIQLQGQENQHTTGRIRFTHESVQNPAGIIVGLRPKCTPDHNILKRLNSTPAWEAWTGGPRVQVDATHKVCQAATVGPGIHVDAQHKVCELGWGWPRTTAIKTLPFDPSILGSLLQEKHGAAIPCGHRCRDCLAPISCSMQGPSTAA